MLCGYIYDILQKSLAEAQNDEKDDGKDNGQDDGKDDVKGDGKDVGKDAGKEKLGKPKERKKSKKDRETKPLEKKIEAPKEVIDMAASRNEDDNISVRAAMYGVLIQCYFDKVRRMAYVHITVRYIFSLIISR